MADRPDIDSYYIEMARVVASRGTCARRQVGCVLTDVNNHVVATGYNGPPSGWPHCRGEPPLAEPCAAATAPSGTNLEGCAAIHGEMNALLQCGDVTKVYTCYTTTCPCVTCAKLLLNTGCRRVVYAESYAHDADTLRLLARGRIEVRRIDFSASQQK